MAQYVRFRGPRDRPLLRARGLDKMTADRGRQPAQAFADPIVS
jgi:hypothetical protein